MERVATRVRLASAVALALVLASLVRPPRDAVAASPCRRTCRHEASDCRSDARAASQTVRADCRTHGGRGRRACVAAASRQLSADRRACRGLLHRCVPCCTGGGSDCGLSCGDGILSASRGEQCDPPGTRAQCAEGLVCTACRCAPPVQTTSTTAPAATSTSTTLPGATTTSTTLAGNLATIAITSPASNAYLNTSPVTVTGTVNVAATEVSINGIVTPVAGHGFAATVPLNEGPNLITAVVTSEDGTTSTASTLVTLDTTPPHVAIYSPADDTITTDTTITVTGLVNDIVVGTVNPLQATVTVNGTPAQVINRTFTATGIPLAIGANTIQATGVDRAGNGVTSSITVTRQPPGETTLRIFSGDAQSGPIHSALPSPLVAQFLDGAGHPVADTPVVFRVIRQDGTLGPAGAPAPGMSSIAVNTDAQGLASAAFTLGSRAGAGNNVVEASTSGVASTAVFTASATATTAGLIIVDAGNNQTGVVGEPLPLPFIAVVTDTGYNRLAGVPVTFTVRSGGGTFAGQPTSEVTSDADGRVAAILTLGPGEGANGNVVEATFAGNSGFPAAFTASGLARGAADATSISGVVLDNSNNPIPGVTMRLFQINQGNAGNVPQEVATPVETDAQGQFVIEPAPVGVFKLMADGGTAQRPGDWPTLEYDIITVPGQNNTVGLPIYLPELLANNRLCVSPTTGGTLTIPQAPGFALTIAPGSATFPGGSRSGCVSVTPVNMDKVPMAPGFGQQPRFVVTIQPVGTRFNPPAAIAIPNVDGLAPRAVTEMYSYDHDLAAFVAIGTGTVSEDGSVIRSDPGVGVLKAGWHCGGNPNQTGSAGTCPDCQKCQGSSCVADTAKNGTACQTNKICKDGNCICPVPTNFHQTGTSDAGGGTLHFDYAWESSTGALSDLSNCTISEEVLYSASELPFPSPPFPAGLSPPNPTILSVPGVDGVAQDNHSTPGAFVKPYQAATVTATQRYRYTCACDNGGNPVVIVGPLSIVRAVTAKPGGNFKFTITKSGSTATIDPLP